MTRTEQWDGVDPADRLDDDLDRMVRGGRPLSGFGPTIEHLYRLASGAWITAQPPILAPRPSPKHTRYQFPMISRRTIMSGLSTAALVALMVAIAFNAFPLAMSVDPPGTRLAAFNQDRATPGAPAAERQDDCTFPPGDEFTSSDPLPVGRSLDAIPDSLVVLDPTENGYMEAEALQITDGRMENPADPFHVGWYEQTATPAERGNVVMAGYVDIWNIGPTALVGLWTMAEGDQIQVNTASGISYLYDVEWTRNYELSAITEADSVEVLGSTAEPALTIITCGGEFDYDAGLYLGRTVVRARLQFQFGNEIVASTEAVWPIGSPPVDPPSPASPIASPVATLGSGLVNAEPRPFAREDCDVEPRTREELIEILGTLPSAVGPGDRNAERLPLDQATFDQLQEEVHDYQACRLFGMTMGWTSLLSEDALRRMVYENGQTTPYSPALLDEIVRGWEEIDAPAAAKAESLTADALANACAIVLAPDQLAEGEMYVTDSLISIPAVLAIGEQSVVNTVPFQYNVTFVLVDGRWRIEQIPENDTCA